jgi:hypothetical protein
MANDMGSSDMRSSDARPNDMMPSDTRPNNRRPLEARSLPDLLSSLINEFSTLFRQEMRLARAETSETINGMMAGAIMLAMGGVLLIPALVLVFEAISHFIVAAGLPVEWATLIVGVFFLVIGLILFLVGVNRLKVTNLAPDRTMEQVRRDAAAAREQIG